MTAIFVVVVGMGILAIADLRWAEVDNWSTAALSVAVLLALVHDEIVAAQWVSAFLCAGAVFACYLELGVRGNMGGGDVKLSPVPALVLGAINPFLAIWGVALGFCLQAAIHVVSRGSNIAADKPLPHVPSMFVATTVTALAGAALFQY
ncbi:A24 family peptidase [Glaciihabitans sp. INWT7]|uniref:A24 family peptidase n=1 Tax=Glaciihabitans sp. INWT7 TaxID=2596912 RepID=UPI001627CE1A|nr:A24 family peptidase [Glaciihabitans sp. INWT7]